MIVTQRRFSNVMVAETEISPTLEAGAVEGGNNLPMIVVGADMYNQNLTGGVSKTIQAERSDNEHIPCVVITDETSDSNGEPVVAYETDIQQNDLRILCKKQYSDNTSLV